MPALPLVENIPDPEEEALLKKEEEDWNKIHEAQNQGAAEVSETEEMPETESSEAESSKKEKDDTQKDE